MYAMILAAGHGKRMLPLTTHTPKPLLKVGGKALIDHQINKLYRAGIRNFVINCGHFGNQIIRHIEQTELPNTTFSYSVEGEDILNTGGGIVNALPLIKSDHFIVANADAWSDYDFTQLLTLNDKMMHLVLVHNPQHNPQGDFALVDGLLSNNPADRLTFSGIGRYHKSLFSGQLQSTFPLVDLMRDAAEQKQASAELFEGHWFDIGTADRLQHLEHFLTSNNLS